MILAKRLRSPGRVLTLGVLLVGATASLSRAEPNTDEASGRWGVTTLLGTGGTGGGYGEFLEKPVDFNLALFKATRSGKWRFGGGFQFDSMTMKAPYEDQKEWARLYLSWHFGS